jgi:hygromycin-B 7''-O-kinase
VRLPAVECPEDLARLRREVAPWRAGLDLIASRHGLAGEPLAEASGTQPVFLYPDAVVKLYAPASLWHDRSVGAPDYAVERATLARLGEMGLAAPRIRGEGEVHDWAYLALTRVRGRPLERVLPELSAEAARTAMRRLGEAVAAVHAVPSRGVVTAVDDFEAFLAAQVRDVVAIEGRRGAPEAWLAPLRRFVDETPRGDALPVLLHTELGPGHALFEGAALGGIIDWAETMVGDAEYDIAAVAFFIARGDGALLGAFLDGYGWSGPMGEALSRRLLRYLLLHRYAPLAWLLEERPVPGARSFDDLAVPWMGLA